MGWRASLLIGILLLVPVVAIEQGGSRAVEPAAQYTVAFASFAPLDTDLFLAEADGSAARPLSPHPDLDYNASFSSDGRWIVFTSHRDGSADIFRVRPDGSGLEKLVDDPSFDDQAVLSPDGRHLAFVSSRSGQADVWTMDLGTKALSNLTNQPGGDFRPEWSPDGRQIAFTSIRDKASFERRAPVRIPTTFS